MKHGNPNSISEPEWQFWLVLLSPEEDFLAEFLVNSLLQNLTPALVTEILLSTSSFAICHCQFFLSSPQFLPSSFWLESKHPHPSFPSFNDERDVDFKQRDSWIGYNWPITGVETDLVHIDLHSSPTRICWGWSRHEPISHVNPTLIWSVKLLETQVTVTFDSVVVTTDNDHMDVLMCLCFNDKLLLCFPEMLPWSFNINFVFFFHKLNVMNTRCKEKLNFFAKCFMSFNYCE